MLPEEWLVRIGALPGMGTAEKDHIRFRKNQAGLLDAFLAARPDTSFDDTYLRARERLRAFEGVHPALQPAGFKGKLRGYQLEGLGWMHFLREFGFGGCLADDMGVGKTPQVLALLETRRELRAAGTKLPPSLVVVPKSLIFNWQQEAARFTPELKVLDYTGPSRTVGQIADHDVVLATYGTLRRDAADFKDIRFDYVVLDEAQAIKNFDTSSAKAARLLCADHRLALSGTPIENHLGELWSIFEFLNPGMLGRAFQNPEEELRPLLARAVRPYILRRTKGQVATELPRRVEQTLFCEMEPAQRKLYDDLRSHYRASLLVASSRAGWRSPRCTCSRPFCGSVRRLATPDSSLPTAPASLQPSSTG
jgi:SNF2 family DNA or RNA helicase